MSQPFLIAVSGGSGSGKTTFVNHLVKELEAVSPVVISLDDYYRDLSSMPPEERDKVNFDHPDALERDLLHEQASLLRAGLTIDKPIYDFASHTRKTEIEKVQPAKVIIFDGIFALCYSELIRLMDLKLYIDVDPDIRIVRRIGRDMSERGRTFEGCAEQYLGSVKAMHQKYVEPSKNQADFVVPWKEINNRAISYIAELVSHKSN